MCITLRTTRRLSLLHTQRSRISVFNDTDGGVDGGGSGGSGGAGGVELSAWSGITLLELD